MQVSPSIHWREGRSHSSGSFNEMLRVVADHAEILASYGEDAGYYTGAPALVRHPVGGGAVYYYGGGFTTEGAYAVMDRMGLTPPLEGIIGLHKESRSGFASTSYNVVDLAIMVVKRQGGHRYGFSPLYWCCLVHDRDGDVRRPA